MATSKKDCFTQHGLSNDRDDNPHPLKSLIDSMTRNYDLPENEGRIKAINELKEKTLDNLQDIYRQVGLPGHEPREEVGPEDPSKPKELVPVDTSKGNITTVSPNEKSTPIDLKTEAPKKKDQPDKSAKKENASEVKPGSEFTFAGNKWTVTEDLGDNIKATNSDETVQTTFPKDAVSKNLVPPGGEPPSTTAAGKEPEKEWTAIRKEKQIEFDNVRKAYDTQETKTWEQSLQRGLEHIQQKYPTDNIYDGSKKELDSLMTALKAKQKPAIDDETLAVLQNFLRETSARISGLEDGRNSDDYIIRQAAMAASTALFADGANAAYVIKEGTTTAGRTLYYAQSEMAFDPQYGLQIRRMQLQQSNGGEPLNDAQLKWTADQWAKEKELINKEHAIREQGMQEAFDKQIARLHDEYKQKLYQTKGSASSEKAPAAANKKTLSQAGKDAADRIRKGKIGGTQAVVFPGVKQAVNVVIEAIAQIVENGSTVAEAIKEFIKDNVEKGKEKEFQDAFLNHVYQSNRNTDSFDNLKLNAEASGATSITRDMVGKNLIRDYVESHIGDMKPGEILDVATAGIKKILPNATKEQLVEAYNKSGAFEMPTKERLIGEFEADKRILVRLSKIEQDLNDLRDKNDVFKKQGNITKSEQIDKEIAAKEKELADALRNRGEKISHEDKYTKASYGSRAKSHNQRLYDISENITQQIEKGDLDQADEKKLIKVKNQIESSSVLLDPKSSLSQRNVLDFGLTRIKEVAEEFDKSTGAAEFKDTKTMLQRAIDKFGKDRDESEQDMKLNRVKDRLRVNNLERERKINAGEFEDKPVIILKKSDADLIRLRIERDKLESGFKYERQKLENKNRSWQRRAFDFARATLVTSYIWKPVTFAKIAATTVLRPNVEAFTKATFGSAFKYISKPVWDAAKGGGESSSLKAVKKSYQAFFMQKGAEGLAKMYKEANDRYELSDKKYSDFASSIEGIKKGDPEYSKTQKALKDLKAKRDSDLIDAVGNSLYQFIGGSSFKDAADALVNRSNIIEREFGFLEKEKFKDGDALDKVKYILEFVGRSHSALKTFSGRANFAAGFISRVEYAVNHGVDVSSPDKMLEIASDSYLDWERGKYQQENFISNIWAGLGNFVERKFKGDKWEKYGKGLSMLMKLDVAITRVPVNILHEAVMEYTLGSVRAFYLMGKEYSGARKEVKLGGVMPGEKEFTNAVREQVSKMDAKQAATIVRCFRKGGFGLGLYALTSIGGLIAYGGFHHKNQKKNYDEDELQPGEIEFMGYRLPKVVSSILEHQSSFFPSLLGQNTAKIYNDKIEAGSTDFAGAMSAILSDLQYMQDQIPQAKILPPIDVIKEVGKGLLKGIGINLSKKTSDN